MSEGRRTGDCVQCGRPVRRHFTGRNAKVSCEKLTWIDALQVGQVVQYWHHIEGRARLIRATIGAFSDEREFVRIHDCHLYVGAEYGGGSTSIYPSTRTIEASRLIDAETVRYA